MNGYIQIKIGENSVGLKFAYPCVKWFTEAQLEDKASGNNSFYVDGVEENESNMTDYGLAKLLQCAYRNNCLLKEEKPAFVFGDFVQWVEDHNNDEGKKEMAEIMTCFAESTFIKKMIEEKEKKNQEQPIIQQ